MKVGLVRPRTIQRSRSRGYSLIELMVVVAMIAVIAGLAAPSLLQSRNDTIAFDHARQYQQIIMQARSRAAGTGAAHLVVMGPGGGTRGAIWLYSAQDPAAPTSPVSTCRGLNQWQEAAQEAAQTAGTRAILVTGDNMNAPSGAVVDMDLTAKLTFDATGTAAAGTAVGFVVICITPSGVTYASGDDNVVTAVANLTTATPFTGFAQAELRRHNTAGTGVGLKRQVIVTGGGNPRLRSQ